MWCDNKTPGCLFDTTDCTGQCCKEGMLMFQRYLDEEYEKSLEQNDEEEKL